MMDGVPSWKRFIRVKVGVDVNSPLPTGFPMDRTPLPVLWIPFKYEKLGSLCYGCGILGHDVKNCPNKEVQKMWEDKVTFGIHGNWLRAESKEFQPGIDLESLANSDMVELGGAGAIEASGSGQSSEATASQGTEKSSPWISAVQLALEALRAVQQRDLMDQSEVWASETTSLPKMAVAVDLKNLDGLASDNLLSCHINTDTPSVQLGEVTSSVECEQLVINQPSLSLESSTTLPRDPKDPIFCEPLDAIIIKPNSHSPGPVENDYFVVSHTREPNGKRKLDHSVEDSGAKKKIREELHSPIKDPAIVITPMKKKEGSQTKRDSSLKARARANEASQQRGDACQDTLMVSEDQDSNRMDTPQSPFSIQLAEEAGLIMPFPLPRGSSLGIIKVLVEPRQFVPSRLFLELRCLI